MPGGTPTRSGWFDALITGCIPVFFAQCTRTSCDVGDHSFIPRYDRRRFGAGIGHAQLKPFSDPSTGGNLDAITPRRRRIMREYIAVHTTAAVLAPGIELREFDDAQAVYGRIVPQLKAASSDRETAQSRSADAVCPSYGLPRPRGGTHQVRQCNGGHDSTTDSEAESGVVTDAQAHVAVRAEAETKAGLEETRRSQGGEHRNRPQPSTRPTNPRSAQSSRCSLRGREGIRSRYDRQIAKLTALPRPFPLTRNFRCSLGPYRNACGY